MNLLYTIMTVIFVALVYGCARGLIRAERKSKEAEFNLLKLGMEKKREKQERLAKEKAKLQAEASNIFTLYEITKDITQTLNETAAFEMFRTKLAEHVSFQECQNLQRDDEELARRQKDPDYFIFTIKYKNKAVGYLSVKGVSDAEKEIVTILANQFALALRRVELYQEIERTAITDSLTELYTRRYTLERLNEEIARSKAKRLKLAFLLIDVDHFKKFNDDYGHLTGDQVLRETGRIIKENLREIDIAGRYGGEEFCVVLPDTDMAGAKFAAERIRQATEAEHFKPYDISLRVTVSIGISQYPQDAERSLDLIEHADAALYQAKKNGRNRISPS